MLPLPPVMPPSAGTPSYSMMAIPAPTAGYSPLRPTPLATMLAISPAPRRAGARDQAAPAARDTSDVGVIDSAGAAEVVATALGTGAETSAPAGAVRRVAATRVLGVPSRERAAPVRVEISVAERMLAVVQGDDTLLVAPAGVGVGDTLRFGGKFWRFDTPVGRRVIRGKQPAPVWVPPEWHYAELAVRNGYTLRHLRAGVAEPLGEGRRLMVRTGRVGVVSADGTFQALPLKEEIVFGRTLYVPPFGTANRRIPGQLGAFRLDMGDGFLIHGTPDESTVGTPSSHGCVRLTSDALSWVYEHVPVGAVITIR